MTNDNIIEELKEIQEKISGVIEEIIKRKVAGMGKPKKEIEHYLIKFKSDFRFFEKERSGLKNNTIRRQSENEKNDKRFNQLFDISKRRADGEIEIEHTDTGETFKRKIKDVSIYNGDLFIITWEDSNDNTD